MRLLYGDEGVRWRRKWEPIILRCKILSENWIKFVNTLRENGLDDLVISKSLIEKSSEIEVREYFRRIYYSLLTLNEIEVFKKLLYEKSREDNQIVMNFVNSVLEIDYDYNGRALDFSVTHAETLRKSIMDYLDIIEKTEPMVDLGGVKMISFDHFENYVNTLKMIVDQKDI